MDAIYFSGSGFDVSIIEPDSGKFKDLQEGSLQFSENSVASTFSKLKKSGQLKIFKRYSDYSDTPNVIIITDVNIINGGRGNSARFGDSLEWILKTLKNTSYTMIIMRVDIRLGIYQLIRDNIMFKRRDIVVGEHYDIILNPRFVGEDASLHDITIFDRIVIGIGDKSAKIVDTVSRLYAAAIEGGTPVFYTDCKTVCFIKYAAITFRLARISLLNEMVDLCCKFEGNIADMIAGLRLDPRLWKENLRAIPGFGESSDIRALEYLMELDSADHLDLPILNSIEKSNKQRLSKIVRKIEILAQEKNSIQNKKIAVLGLSFKSSDISMSPSIFIINHLLGCGASVSVYDPLFTPNSILTRKIPTNIMKNINFSLADSPYNALERSDVAVITTDYPCFVSLDARMIKKLMNKSESKRPIVFDLVGILNKNKWDEIFYISQDIELHSDDPF
jgi:UDPglucose 6-dehydrogenase